MKQAASRTTGSANSLSPLFMVGERGAEELGKGRSLRRGKLLVEKAPSRLERHNEAGRYGKVDEGVIVRATWKRCEILQYKKKLKKIVWAPSRAARKPPVAERSLH